LLSFADSSPRAYWLKVGNASLPNSTAAGTFPGPGGVTVIDDGHGNADILPTASLATQIVLIGVHPQDLTLSDFHF
jgi:hypothetical protein